MFNKTKFKAAAVLSGLSMAQIANRLGINLATLYRKINRDGDFSRSEIQILRSILGIENMDDIFFANNLTETQESSKEACR